MSKLLQFKEWCTIKEASCYLSEMLQEKVKTKDIYRLALDNKLVLSLHFINPTYVEIASPVKSITTSIDPNNIISLTDQITLFFNQQALVLIGGGCCCDLLNINQGNITLKKYFYKDETLEIKVDKESSKGILFVFPYRANYYCRLINSLDNDKDYSPITFASVLPNDIYLVVKTRYLQNFINKVNNFKDKVPIADKLYGKERISLYKIIALLTKLNDLSLQKEFKAASVLKTYGETIGFEGCPSRDTMAKYLKEANNYLLTH